MSGAIGLYLVDQFGERDGNALLSIAVVASVGINALVSPILGAFSDRGAGRMPFLLFFTALCIGTTFFIASLDPLLGLVLFIVANFAYQAALIYYDATLKTVSYPATRGKLSGLGTGIGYCGTVFVGLLIFFLDVPVADRFRLTSHPVPDLRDPDLRLRARAADRRAEGRAPPPRSGTPSGSCAARSRTRARCRALGGSSSAGSSTPTRSTRSSWS